MANATFYETDTEPVQEHDRSKSGQQTQDSFAAGKVASKNKWLLLFVGGITALAGLASLAMPFVASLTAAVLVGWLLILSGGVGLFAAIRRHEGWEMAAAFAVAIVSLVGGVLMLAQPIAGLFALTTVLMAYFAATGVLRLWYGAKSLRSGGGWLIASGALSLILAVFLFAGLPYSATWVPGLMLGVDLLFLGASQIALAIRVGQSPETSHV